MYIYMYVYTWIYAFISLTQKNIHKNTFFNSKKGDLFLSEAILYSKVMKQISTYLVKC